MADLSVYFPTSERITSAADVVHAVLDTIPSTFVPAAVVASVLVLLMVWVYDRVATSKQVAVAKFCRAYVPHGAELLAHETTTVFVESGVSSTVRCAAPSTFALVVRGSGGKAVGEKAQLEASAVAGQVGLYAAEWTPAKAGVYTLAVTVRGAGEAESKAVGVKDVPAELVVCAEPAVDASGGSGGTPSGAEAARAALRARRKREAAAKNGGGMSTGDQVLFGVVLVVAFVLYTRPHLRMQALGAVQGVVGSGKAMLFAREAVIVDTEWWLTMSVTDFMRRPRFTEVIKMRGTDKPSGGPVTKDSEMVYNQSYDFVVVVEDTQGRPFYINISEYQFHSMKRLIGAPCRIMPLGDTSAELLSIGSAE